MTRRSHGANRDIVRRRVAIAAFGPVLGAVVGLAACAPDGAPNVQVPMLAVNDPVFDAATSAPSAADGGKDGGVVELEPNPPAGAFACRRDVACVAVAVGVPSPSPSPSPSPGGAAPSPKRLLAPSAEPGAVLPSPFDHCPLADDKGRHFSARETRDARLNDAARCCYVAFVDCVRGSGS
jgi:hypothetical protein